MDSIAVQYYKKTLHKLAVRLLFYAKACIVVPKIEKWGYGMVGEWGRTVVPING